MFYKKDGNVYAVRPEVGEDIVKVLLEICERENIGYAVVSGIGGMSRVTVGCYSHEHGKYLQKTFEEPMEMISLQGNVSKKDGKAYLHVHASFSGVDCNVVGGHLFEAVVGITGEIFLTVIDGNLNRIINPSNEKLTILDI